MVYYTHSMNTIYLGILVIIVLLSIIALYNDEKQKSEPFDLRTDCWNERIGCHIACQTNNVAIRIQCLEDCYKNSVIC